MLYVSDLDGTLVSENIITNESKNVINDLLSKGLLFTFASARDYESIKLVSSGINIDFPIIALDGSYIIDYKTGERIIVNNISSNIVKELNKFFKKEKVHPFCAATNLSSDFLLYEKIINKSMNWCIDSSDYFKDQEFRKIETLSDLKNYKVARYILTDNTDRINMLFNKLNSLSFSNIAIESYVNYYVKGASWLIISSKKATKKLALDQLLKIKNIKSTSVTYFSDNYNDLDIFKSNIRSCAVGNAVEEAKALATYIIRNSNENAVANFMKNDF